MASSLPPRSSYQKKENVGLARRVREMGYKSTPRRNVLSALNNGEVNGGTRSTPSDGGAAEAAHVIEFGGREDVERLLAEKMKGKKQD